MNGDDLKRRFVVEDLREGGEDLRLLWVRSDALEATADYKPASGAGLNTGDEFVWKLRTATAALRGHPRTLSGAARSSPKAMQ